MNEVRNSMVKLVAVACLLMSIILVACQDPTPSSTPKPTPTFTVEPPKPTPTATPEPTTPPTLTREVPGGITVVVTPNPSSSTGDAFISMLSEAAGGLSAETRACVTDLLEDDPALAEVFTSTEDLSGPSMLSLMACLTPEEAATLTPPDEGPPPDAPGIACLIEELEGAPEKDRILAVLGGADPSGEGLTLEESAVLGQAVEACDVDTGFGFPGGGDDNSENALANTEWRLEISLRSSDAPRPAVPGSEPIVRFTEEVVEGWTGCNSYGGTYRVNNGSLAINDPVWTLELCPSHEMSIQEDLFQGLLVAVESFEISGDQLVISSDEGASAMVFRRVGE